MDYTQEEIYELVGRQDKTANITFKTDSEGYNLYGSNITVVFLYTQREREELDKQVKDPANKTAGKVRAKNLLSGLTNEKVEKLEKEGINSSDIASMLYFRADEKNTFHSAEKRSITKITVPIHTQSKGRDYDWMYGFSRKMVLEGIGLSPKEKAFYLAGKIYYEPDAITPEEKEEIFSAGDNFAPDVEWEYLLLKLRREEASEEEKRKLSQLSKIKDNKEIDLLDQFLKEAGNSFLRLAKENIDEATHLLVRINRYQEHHLNITGKTPIYLPVNRYLHVYMRHVEELKFNKQFEGKTNFQWAEQDVMVVLEKIIERINDEVQNHFESKPGQRYSRFGPQSIYFEGDYYDIHIEADGGISTFYRNQKKHD